MAEHERRLHDEIADGAGFIVMQIAAAHADILDLHEHLVVLRLRDGPLLDLNLADLRHDGRFHHAFHFKNSFPLPRAFRPAGQCAAAPGSQCPASPP